MNISYLASIKSLKQSKSLNEPLVYLVRYHYGYIIFLKIILFLYTLAHLLKLAPNVFSHVWTDGSYEQSLNFDEAENQITMHAFCFYFTVFITFTLLPI